MEFISSLRSKATKVKYTDALVYFLKFLDNANMTCDRLLKLEPKQLQGYLIEWIVDMRDNRKLAPGTIKLRTAGLQAFLSLNEIEGINWKKVKKFQGEFYRVAEDRPYTREEVKLLVEAAGNLRDRAIILLFASSGLREGGLVGLKLKHLTKIEDYNLYMIHVYKKTREEYITFCTPEARKAIDEYLNWRVWIGEKLEPDSPLFRKQFYTRYADTSEIEPITISVIANMVRTLRLRTGIVENQRLTEEITKGMPRTHIMLSHGLRKHFATTLETEGVNTFYIELLLGHDTGLKGVYSKPTSTQLLEGNGDRVRGYTAGIDALTIDEEHRLKDKIQSLEIRIDEFAEQQKQIDELKAKIGDLDELTKRARHGHRLGEHV